MIGATLILVCLEAVLGLAAWLLCGRRPDQAALGLLAVTAPLEDYRTPLLGVNVSLFRLSLVVALAVLARGRLNQLRQPSRDPITLAYALLAAIMAISLVLFSDNRSLGFRVLSQVAVGTVAMVVVAGLVRRIGHPVRVAGTLVVGVALPIAAGFWQASFGSTRAAPLLPFLASLPAAPGLEVSRIGSSFAGATLRVKSTFADPNHFGAYCALLLGPLLGLLGLAAGRRSVRWIAASSAVVIALVCMILLSGSRSAWLAAGVCVVGCGAAFLPALLRGMSSRARGRAALGSAVAVAVLALVGSPIVASRLNDATAANRQSNETHSLTLRRASDDLVEMPVLGIGLSDFGPQLGEGPLTSGAHSTYLTVGAELGFVGLFALLAVLVLTGRALAAGIRRGDGELRMVATGLACGYAGFALAAAFYDLWWDDFQWLIAGSVLGLCGAVAGPLSGRRAVGRRRPQSVRA
ncbi:MAG TPA: O-antigen ligase family protein [Solirubrobacteraceae bacterium]